MTERPEGSATPVGLKRQSAEDVTEPQLDAPTGSALVETNKILKANNIDPAEAARYAARFGAKDPMKAIAKHCAGQEVD